MRWAWRKRLGGFAAAVFLVLGACTQSVTVGPEGRFSWDPQSQMVWPVEGAIVSPFGDAARPDHRGIDLAARPGEPVAAAALGRAEFVGEMPGYGYVVILSHGDDLSTVYAHLGSVRVREGETVSRGQTIGYVAAGGYVHYEIRRAKEAVDPASFYAVAPQPLIGGSVYTKKNVAAEPVAVGAPLAVDAPLARDSVAPGARLAPKKIASAPQAERSPVPHAAPPLEEAEEPAARALVETPAPPSAAVRTASPPPLERAAAPSAGSLVEEPARPPAPPAAAPAVSSPARPRETARPSTVLPEPPPPSAASELEPAAPSAAAERVESSDADDGGSVGMGAAVVGANLVYMPAKFAYAGVGAVTGGMALFLSHDLAVANDVWRPTLGGDYVVTERHLRGEAPLRFLGDR